MENCRFGVFKPIIASFQPIKTYHTPLKSSCQGAFNGATGAYFIRGFPFQLDRKRGYQLKSCQDTVIGHLLYRSIIIAKNRCSRRKSRVRAVELKSDRWYSYCTIGTVYLGCNAATFFWRTRRYPCSISMESSHQDASIELRNGPKLFQGGEESAAEGSTINFDYKTLEHIWR